MARKRASAHIRASFERGTVVDYDEYVSYSVTAVIGVSLK